MQPPIDFYFDFSSPYGYLASTRIDALAASYGREAAWRPILLGVAFKATGQAPLLSIPLKGDYAARDIARSARFYGVEYRQPSVFPIGSVAPSRAFYWLAMRDPAGAKRLAAALFRAYFVDDIDISKPENTIATCAKFGLEAASVEAALNDETIKTKLKNEVAMAMNRGVFGSPYIVIDGEPFWGVDRLEQVEKWLANGEF